MAPVEPETDTSVPSSAVSTASWRWPATTSGTSPATADAIAGLWVATTSGRCSRVSRRSSGAAASMIAARSSFGTVRVVVTTGSSNPRMRTPFTSITRRWMAVTPGALAIAARFSIESWLPATK